VSSRTTQAYVGPQQTIRLCILSKFQYRFTSIRSHMHTATVAVYGLRTHCSHRLMN